MHRLNYFFSNSNINQLSRFYSSGVTNLIHHMEKEFYLPLKEILNLVNLKKVPVLSIFLLFCIKPFNRKAILNLVIQIHQYIKYNGKYVILCRLYKELLQLKNLSVNKEKWLLRKDLPYPSTYMLNLK